MTLREAQRRFEVAIIDGCARTLWLLAYSSFAPLNSYCGWCGQHIVREDERSETWTQRDTGEAACADAEDDGQHVPQDDVGEDAIFPVPDPGGNWDDVAPATPAVADACARALVAAMQRVEGAAIADLFEAAMIIHQGEWMWTEESSAKNDSRRQRQELESKLEDAWAFGAGIAGAFMDSSIGWGDHHKTSRGGARFEMARVRGEFEIVDFDLARWTVEQTRSVDTIQRHIGIAGPILPDELRPPAERPYGEWIDVDPDDLQGMDSIAEWTASSIRDEAHDVTPSTPTPELDTYYTGARTRTRPTASRVVTPLTFTLLGYFPAEREWTYYFLTEKIGRIHLANTPGSGEYDYHRRGRGQGFDGVSDGNVLLWFGEIDPTYLLVFASSAESAFDVGMDWIEEHEPDYLCDDQITEQYKELVEAACKERGLPDESLLSERELEEFQEEAEQDTSSGGNHGRRIMSDHWGIEGENLTTEQLRKIGFRDELPAWLQVNPAEHAERRWTIGELARQVHEEDRRDRLAAADTVRVDPIPFAHRSSASGSRRSSATPRRR